MKNKQYILFDMDGTINDSAEGIINGITYTLSRHGITDIKREEVIKYIGPSFRHTLTNTFGFDENMATEVHGVMRDYMMRQGIYENSVYGGIRELLQKLKARGKTVALATAKWSDQAEVILKHYDLAQYFDFVGGVDDNIVGKVAVIKHVLNNLGVKDKTKAVMVGDRENDILGAAENGIDCIGVLYGYGTIEELEVHKPEYIVSTVEELTKLLCG